MSAIAHVAPISAAARRARAWYALLVAGLAVGLGCFAYQWANGLTVTGMSNTVSWGMYIISFMFLVGISAGGLIVVAGSELVRSKRFEPLGRLAIVVSATAIAAAAISILPDLGRPQLVWKMLLQPNFTSPLVWDVAIITTYLAIAVADLWIMTRPEPRPGALRLVAFIALPAAVLVHSVTAWIFGLVVARPFWNTALMAPLFISSALVSGTALVILAAHIAQRTTAFAPPDRVFPDLGRLMVWFIGADVFLLFAEVLTTITSRVPDHVEQLRVLLFGRLAWVFWSEVALGAMVPFVIFAVPRLRASRPWLVTGASLALIGVFFKRVNILLSALFEPLVGLAPGIPGGRPGQPFRPDQIYVPTWVEWGVLLGLASFVGLAISLGVRYLVLPRGRHEPV
ncbi:MAG TPA: NrfD/PsrC family molybdoenzyme membrane anchor subunit [Actinomycetota bacterium]|nr:NrfD/PsrC family molybdoenzyme membrane anchor subunit [Actinomycetota bacterium]